MADHSCSSHDNVNVEWLENANFAPSMDESTSHRG